MKRSWRDLVLGGVVTGALLVGVGLAPQLLPSARAVETTTDVTLKIGTTDVAVVHHEKIGTTIDCLVVVVKDTQPTVACQGGTSTVTTQ
jgi:uncharacterized membrane protein